jgi:hypothetical protein
MGGGEGGLRGRMPSRGGTYRERARERGERETDGGIKGTRERGGGGGGAAMMTCVADPTQNLTCGNDKKPG